MRLAELIAELRRAGVKASESQIRWAIKTGKVRRPRLNGSRRFDFQKEDVTKIATYFSGRAVAPRHRSPFTRPSKDLRAGLWRLLSLTANLIRWLGSCNFW